MADTLEKGTKRKRGSLAKALLVTLIVVVLVIVLLPSIISLGPVRRMVISSVDDRVGGDLDIASWKLTWSRGVRVSGLSFKSEQINATVDSIETTSGLLKLLPREVNAGDIVITRPEVRYIQATRLDEAKEKVNDEDDEGARGGLGNWRRPANQESPSTRGERSGITLKI